MFGLFKTSSPLDVYEKVWTEWRMRWFAEQFGLDQILQCEMILPTKEYFPYQINGEKDVRTLMEQLSGYLNVDLTNVELEIADDSRMIGRVGEYQSGERAVIRVAASQLQDPLLLTATIAHELSHEILLGRNLIDASFSDHEMTTDLLPVYSDLESSWQMAPFRNITSDQEI